MADGHQEKERKRPQPIHFRVGRIALIIVGCVVMIGAVAYAYDLGFRQGARHAPPLITADTTPTKMPPEAPGGIEIPHQDKLVYQRLSTARAPVESRAETLLPPPEEPMPRPPPEEAPQVASAENVVSDAGPANESMAVATTEKAEEVVSASDAAASVKPSVAARPTPVPEPKVEATSVPAVTTVAAKAQTKPATASPPVSKPEIAKLTAPSISAGYVVQVGSFRSGEAARAGWQRLAKRHVALIEKMPHRVAQVDLGAGKGIYHRLQVGTFETRAAAGALCRQLKTQGQDCLVVKR